MRDTIPRTTVCAVRCDGGVNTVRFSSNGKYLVGGGGGKVVRLWDTHGVLVKPFYGCLGGVLDAALGHTGGLLAACGEEKAICVWDVANGEVPLRRLRGHQARVNCLAFSHDDQVLFSASHDATLRAWDIRAPRAVDPLQTLTAAEDAVTTVDVNGHIVTSGSLDGRVRQYDIRSGLLSTDRIGEAVACVATTRNAARYLATTLDSTHRLFDALSGTVVTEYTGHTNTTHTVRAAFTHDEQHILSGSEDGRMCYWDTRSGELVASMPLGARVVSSVDYHPTARLAVCGGDDGVVKVFGFA